jgi:hypothetical protein
LILLIRFAGFDASSFGVGHSPFGLLASPLSNIDLMSPESTMSFSLSSPPPQNARSLESNPSKDMLNANISPSIFSPEEFGSLKFLARDREQNFTSFSLFDEAKKASSSYPLNEKKILLSRSSTTYSNNREFFSSDAILQQQQQMTKELSSSEDENLPSSKTKSTWKLKKPFKLLVEEHHRSSQSPHNDIARRLSLESGSEPVVHSLRINNEEKVSFSSSSGGKKALLSQQAVPPKASSLRTTCNCKKSRCLKLYCDCFAILKFCDATFCNCVSCYNNADNEDKRNEAIKSTKEKNILAFQTKISADKDQHVTGCHCKNSHCLKKYCECFTGSALCGINCKCQSCKNYEGSVDLLKTREASPKNSEASVAGKKRKESPNSVFWIDESSPLSTQSSDGKQLLSSERKSTYSLRTSTKEKEKKLFVAPVSHQIQLSSNVTLTNPVKRRKVKFAATPIVYPFFGDYLPEMPKIIALKILDSLPDKDFYTMASANSLWNKAAMDDALWE